MLQLGTQVGSFKKVLSSEISYMCLLYITVHTINTVCGVNLHLIKTVCGVNLHLINTPGIDWI